MSYKDIQYVVFQNLIYSNTDLPLSHALKQRAPMSLHCLNLIDLALKKTHKTD